MPREAPLTAPIIEHFLTRKPLRTGSLIVTLFGDSIAPRGGSVWIGSLINVLAPLGISARSVRTSVFRLVQDGTLDNQAVGRRSFYSLTAQGRAQFDAATLKIYTPPEGNWDGQWCLILIGHLAPQKRAVLRQTLGWLGFGQLSPDTLAHPRPNRTKLQQQLQHLLLADEIVMFDARVADESNPNNRNQVVAQTWNVSHLENAYHQYLDLFEPILPTLQDGITLDAEDAFYIRSFMIHEYRKIVLRDPDLPTALLPMNWPGDRAYAMTQALYRSLVDPSEHYIDHHLVNHEGPLPAVQASFEARFGGLITR